MILNESKRDELLLPYLNIYKEKTGQSVPLGRFKEMMLYKLGVQGGLQNLSQSSNYYLVGATRYYFNGDLTNNNDLSIFHEDFNDDDSWNREITVRLNACINVLRNAYIDSVGTEFEQPEDFGTLSLPRLLRKYNKKINAELGIEEEPKKKKKEGEEAEEPIDYNVGNGYTFDILYSYNDATKYNVWTQPGAWCITYGSCHYNGYIRRLDIHYVIFLKDGYQEIKRPNRPGPGFTNSKPHDEYGNSMIAVLQSNESWEPIYITSRWNHGAGNVSCEADHAYTTEEFCQITGVTPEDLEKIYNIWLKEKDKRRPRRQRTPEDPQVKAKALAQLRKIKYAQMRINGGENANSLFNVEEVLYGREGAEHPETGEVLYDFKNSVYVCSLKKNGTEDDEEEETDGWGERIKTMFLVDKGKTVFETISKHILVWSGDKGFTTAEKYYGRIDPEDKYKMHNLVLFKKMENGPWMLYDTRRHDFVDIGGIKRFKYLPLSWSSNNFKESESKFYVVKQTGEKMALVKISNNLPLRLPNGEFWFARLKCKSCQGWGRYVNGKFVGTKEDAFLQITTSNDEVNRNTFFYSISKNSFFDMPNFNSVSPDFNNCEMDASETIEINGKTHNVVRYFNNTALGYAGVRCVIDENANLVKVAGFTLFKDIYSPSNAKHILFIEPDLSYFKESLSGYDPYDPQGDHIVYDSKTDSVFKINGKILQGYNAKSYGGTIFSVSYHVTNPNSHWDFSYEYLFNGDQILKNPIGYPSNYSFEISTYNCYPEIVFTLYTQPNTEGVRWYDSDERSKEIYRNITTKAAASDLRGVPIDKQPIGQLISESYIRQMVSEALKKLMNNGK